MNGQEIFRFSYLRAILGSSFLVGLLVVPAAAQAATVDIDSFDLPPGKSVTIEFEVTVDSPMPPGDTQVCNQGTITATNPVAGVLTDDPDVGGATDSTCTTIQLIADLSVTKSDGATTEVPGTPVTYTIVAANAGPATVADGVVVDTFPGLLSGCSTTSVAAGGASGNDVGPTAGNINDTGLIMPSGATVTYTVTCNILPAATGSLVNTVTISSAATTDPAPADNSASDSDTLVPSTDVAITKTDGATTEIPGTSVIYTIVASNSGPSTATGVTVADTFPGILSGCSTSSVAAGGATGNDAGPTAGSFSDSGITLPPSATVTYTATCTIAASATGTLDNTATISSATTDPNGGNNSATDSDTLDPQANLAITKTDGSTSEVPGTPVTYTITVTNATGPSVATGVTVSDTFTATLTGCSTTSVAAGGATGNDAGPTAGNISDSGITLPVGASVTYTATCNIDGAATGTLVNTASVSTAITDPVPGNNSATDSDTLAPSADLLITKTDGAVTEIPGTPVTYTIVASNSGPSTATSVTVADTFPASLTGCSTTSVAAGGATGNDVGPTAGNVNDGGITLPSGSSVTYTATCNVDPTATGSLANTATVTAATTDPNGGNNSATDTDTLTPQADLAITKTDGAATEVPGTPVTYTITVTNAAGPSTAGGVTVADTFPAILTGCSTTSAGSGGATGNDAGPTAGNINDGGISLPTGSSVTWTATCNVSAAATGSLSNTATVASSSDSNAGNDSATDTDTLVPSADVAISKTDGAASEIPGTAVTYTIVASNSGPSTATGVTVADTFPAILTGCSTTSVAAGGATGNDAGPTAGSFSDSGITLPPSSTVTYTATCNIAATATGSLANTATISTATADPNNANDSATDTDTLVPTADVSITKTDGVASENPGTSITYTIVASNATGPSEATGVTVADTFPATLTGCSTTSVAAGGATGNDAGPTAGSWSDGGITLPVGATVTYTVNCNIDPAATGSLANTATVTTAVTDGNAANDSATDTDTLSVQIDLVTTKTDGAVTEVPGTGLTYTIGLSNLGPSTATNVTLADTFVAALTGCSTTSVAAGGATGNDAGPTAGNLNDTGITLPPAASVTYTVSCTIDPAATGSLANTATASGGGGTEATPGDNSATDTDTLAPSADVAVTKTDGVPSIIPGGTTTYTVVLSNAGPSTSVNITLADTIPVAFTSCSTTSVAAGGATGNDAGPTVGDLNDTGITLPPSGSVTYTMACNVSGAATGTVVNTASATVTTTDPNGGNNSASDSDTVTPLDLGDAPTAAQSGFAGSYPTTLAQDGARHVDTGPTLGAARDFEANGQPTLAADGDDANGTDDEDGVTLTPPFVACQSASATVSASGSAVLQAWIDWNRDGDWADLGEQVATDQAVIAGPNTVNFTVPCGASIGTTYARFRLSTASGVSFIGQVANGEVEDYALPITAVGDLSITKTDGLTAAVPGQTSVVYTIVAGNAGPSPLAGVSVADTFPAVLACGWTSVAAGGATGNTNNAGPANLAETLFLPVGSSVTYTATCTINPSATGTLVNTATVATSLVGTSDPSGANNSATDNNTVLTPIANLQVTKTDGSATEIPGTPVTYTIVVSNLGPSTDPNATVADTFPASLSGCSTTSVAAGGATGNDLGPTAGNLNDGGLNLPPGASVTYTSTCNLASSATGTLANTATVSASVTDSVPANNTATDTDTLTPQADLAITKTDGAATEIPGTTVQYTIVASNSGPSDNPNVNVADTFAAPLSACSWTTVAGGGATGNDNGSGAALADNVNLPNGGSVTYTVTCSIAPAATGSLANTATVATGGAVTDPAPGNNSATDTDSLVPTVDLQVTKTDGNASEVPGTTVTYTIVVSNAGPSTDPNVTVADTFTGILAGCSTTSVAAGGATGNDVGPTAGNVNDSGVGMPPGSSVTYTAACTISSAATGSLANTATATASVTESSSGDNTATDTDTLTPQADLEITKVVDDPSVMVGQAIVYTLTVVNHGPSDATAVVISDPLPGAITFVSSTGCVESPAGGVPTCTLGGLVAGATAPAVTINATVNANGTSVNTASVASAVTDPASGNNSDTATVATDLIPPIVTGVDSVANTGDGSLDACETARFPINQLKITFGEALENLSGVAPNDAGNPANYRLIRAGGDQTFQTSVCGPALGDDVAVSIDSVLYQLDTPSAPLSRSTLTVNGGAYLPNGLYRLFACSTLRDLATNPLDGDGNLTGGDDFVRLFRVDTDNMFVNGYLDCAETGWDETPPSSPEMVWDPATDADASPHSGSFGVGTSGTASLGVSQCVTFGALGSFEAPPYHLEGKVRFDGDPGERVTVRLSCQSFSGTACGGTSLGTSQSSVLVDALPFTRFAFDPVVPPAALSARCGITLQNAVPPNAYGAYLDQMLLLGTGGLPFADGFESGNVGAWSGHTP